MQTTLPGQITTFHTNGKSKLTFVASPQLNQESATHTSSGPEVAMHRTAQFCLYACVHLCSLFPYYTGLSHYLLKKKKKEAPIKSKQWRSQKGHLIVAEGETSRLEGFVL